MLGLAVGIGWWATPEIVYFAVPLAVLLVASWDRLYAGERRWAGPWRPAPVLVAAGGIVVGALPWIFTNVRTGFVSLRTGSLPDYQGIGYGGRLECSSGPCFPSSSGCGPCPVAPGSVGRWWAVCSTGSWPRWWSLALVRAALVARQGRRAAPLVGVAAGVVAFPFVYALVPATGYWVDGRYGVLLPSLVVLVLVMALSWPGARAETAPVRARHARPARTASRSPTRAMTPVLAVALAGVLAAGALTTATADAGGVPTTPSAFAAGWGDPEAPARHVVAEMQRHHIRYAYGSYWTAYVLDALDPDRVVVTPSHLDVVRWPEAAAAVRSSPDPAYLFSAPGHLHAAGRGLRQRRDRSGQLHPAAVHGAPGGAGGAVPGGALGRARRGGARPPGDPPRSLLLTRPPSAGGGWHPRGPMGRALQSNACSCWGSTRASRAAATAWSGGPPAAIGTCWRWPPG